MLQLSTAAMVALAYNFEKDRDYNGNDIFVLEDVSIEYCNLECSKFDACKAFTFDVKKSKCFLKDKAANKKHCSWCATSNQITDARLEDNYDYYGSDISSFKTNASAKTCARACALTEECHKWTYSRKKETCFLKDYGAGRNEYDQAISGDKPAYNTVYHGVSPMLDSDKYLRSFDSFPSGSYCASFCDADPDCFRSSYSQKSKMCYFHSPIYNKYEKDPDNELVYELNAPIVDYGISLDLEAVMCEGTSTFKVENVTHCKLACTYKDDCLFWTYYNTTKECHLMKSVKNYKDNSDAISGDKPRQEITDHDYGYWGYNSVDHVKLTTRAECEQTCFLNDKCKFWDWNIGEQRCEMKSRVKDRRSAGSETSGAYPWERYTQESTCYNGGDYDVTEAMKSTETTLRECQAICSVDPNCDFYTYRHEGKKCELKNSKEGQDIVTDSNCTSGNKPWPLKIEDGTLDGGDIVSFKADQYSCSQLCAYSDNCIRWVHNDGICSIKDKDGKLEGGTAAKSALRGLSPFNEYGFWFHQGEIANSTEESAEKCALSCSNSSACNFYTYRDNVHSCYHIGVVKYYYPKKPKADVVGSRPSVPAVYTGFSIISSNSTVYEGDKALSSKEECKALCDATIGDVPCKSWTYNGTQCFINHEFSGPIISDDKASFGERSIITISTTTTTTTTTTTPATTTTTTTTTTTPATEAEDPGQDTTHAITHKTTVPSDAEEDEEESEYSTTFIVGAAGGAVLLTAGIGAFFTSRSSVENLDDTDVLDPYEDEDVDNVYNEEV
eukprot:GHVH01000980.1.p1 GENE.GHVH01000980.1~~GHVH01000980.1.p1  ORF type:complete len:783 (+),score=81.86 GHVH01000980.1:61-2409(+)